MKRSVEDLNSQQDVCDLIREMKKEIGELKKDIVSFKAKTNAQLSDDDFFRLDEDYNTGDYSLSGPTTAAATSNLYQNYTTRVGAGPVPGYPSVYHAGMAPIYPYGLALQQAAGKINI